jgi:phosphate transport system substrate-binding protein
MKITSVLLNSIACVLLVTNCNQSTTKYSDTPTTGRIKMMSDETLQPICNSEIQVFENLYPYAAIDPVYLPEKKIFENLIADSVRLVITSRKLTSQEEAFFNAKKVYPRQTKIAIDALALLVNPRNKDSIFSVGNIKDILTGKIQQWSQLNPASKLGKIVVVFDNPNSSTVRFAMDSITRGVKLSTTMTALDYNKDVIDYVSRTPNAMGIIGVSWVSDRADSTNLTFLKKVRVVALTNAEKPDNDNSFKPFQAYVIQKSYPLTRFIYVINAEPRQGLASGFAAFLASDRGQRIILRSGILPATQPLRIIQVRNDF